MSAAAAPGRSSCGCWGARAATELSTLAETPAFGTRAPLLSTPGALPFSCGCWGARGEAGALSSPGRGGLCGRRAAEEDEEVDSGGMCRLSLPPSPAASPSISLPLSGLPDALRCPGRADGGSAKTSFPGLGWSAAEGRGAAFVSQRTGAVVCSGGAGTVGGALVEAEAAAARRRRDLDRSSAEAVSWIQICVRRIKIAFKLSGNEVYCTKPSLSLTNIMLCSKLHCKKVSNRNLFPIRLTPVMSLSFWICGRAPRAASKESLQGYLAHKKQRAPRTLQ